MRDPLHVCSARQALGIALVGAALMAMAPAPAAGKVLRPQVADRIDDPGVAERPPVQVQTAPAAETAATTEPASQAARPAKSKSDPNAPEPLSERAAAAGCDTDCPFPARLGGGSTLWPGGCSGSGRVGDRKSVV